MKPLKFGDDIAAKHCNTSGLNLRGVAYGSHIAWKLSAFLTCPSAFDERLARLPQAHVGRAVDSTGSRLLDMAHGACRRFRLARSSHVFVANHYVEFPNHTTVPPH